MTELKKIRHPQYPEEGYVFLGDVVTVRLPDNNLILDYVVAIMTTAITESVPTLHTSNGYMVYEDEETYRKFHDSGWGLYQTLKGVIPAEKLLRTGWLDLVGEPLP